MDKYWILLVAVSAIHSASTGTWGGDWNNRGPPHHRHGPPHQRHAPPHHWHDCGSSEMDWDKAKPWKDTNEGGEWNGNNNGGWDGNNNGGWFYPDHHNKPRPPWPGPQPPRPTPQPGPNPQPTRRPWPTPQPEPNPQPTPRPWPGPQPTPQPGPNPQPTPQPWPNPQPTPRPAPNPLPTPEDLQTCLRNCPVTSQYNPVCGTDGVTYNNIGRLDCAQFCGVDVQLALSSRCPTTGSTSPSPPTTSTPPFDLQACISRCPATTPEYNPVCGSDGVTYDNPSRLECARSCGVNVQLARSSRCPTNMQTTGNPITNPTIVTSLPTSATPPTISTPPNRSEVTISKDILDLIFTSTTEADTTGLIDERYQDN